LFLIDLIYKNITGKEADIALGDANITVNKNTVPNDPRSPFVTSGLRVGTPACTTRGFKEPQMQKLAQWMADILDNIHDQDKQVRIKKEVIELCCQFPVYGPPHR
jgi:glycine hydroxymethyltransferase